MNRLKEKYLKEVVPSLQEKYNYKSKMEIPKLEKIVINMGVGDATTNSKLLEAAIADLTKISGQKPVITRAKKSIAGFKIREAQLQKIPYMLIVGEKEAAENTVSVRSRDNGEIGSISLDEFLSTITKEVEERKNIEL